MNSFIKLAKRCGLVEIVVREAKLPEDLKEFSRENKRAIKKFNNFLKIKRLVEKYKPKSSTRYRLPRTRYQVNL